MAQSTRTAGTVVVAPAAATKRRFNLHTFDSLAIPSFRWFYAAMLGQMAAMNMQLVIRGYVVFELTGSYAALGGVAMAAAMPMLILGPFGGVLADRLPKKTVLQTGQLISVVNALIVGALLLADVLVIWHLVVASIAQGTTMALMMPSRQAMIPDVVDKDRLMNAVALNSAGMNLMRLLAPAVGGFLIYLLGEGSVYLVMAGLYFLAVVTLTPVPRVAAAVTGAARKGGLGDLRDGFTYVRRDPTILAVLGISFLSAFLAMPYIQLLPAFVKDVLDGGPVLLGILVSISGGGALFGALVIASLPPRRRGLLMLASTILLGASLLVFASSNAVWFAAIAIVFVGVGTAGRQAFGQVLIHAYVADEYRGRVMSLMMFQPGMMSLGAVVVGLLAEAIGVEYSMGLLAGSLVLLSALILMLSPRLRRLA